MLTNQIIRLHPSRNFVHVLYGVSCTRFALVMYAFFAVSAAMSQTVLTAEDSLRLKQQNEMNTTVAAGIQYDKSFIEKKLKQRGQKISVFGYYRLFGYGRNFQEYYPGLPPYQRAYSIGDGYREPMLSMTVLARPSGKTSFGTELFIFTPYDGSTEGNVFTTNLGINFYGNFSTEAGNFGIRAGGIHWYNLSPFTIGIYQVLNRFSIFDRTPWEGVSNTEKYDSYYSTGATSPGDLRWNNQAFQGLILNGTQLPGNISADFFWGKTQPNGGLVNAILEPSLSIPPTLDAGNVPNYFGFAGDGRVLPSVITGGKIARAFGAKKQQLAYNVIHSRTALDSIRTDSARSYQVHTVSLNLSIGKAKVTGELGAGNYQSPTYGNKWGEALMLRFNLPEEYTFLPLDIQVFQISKNFFNQNGEIATNSNQAIIDDNGLTINANGAGGQLAQAYQLIHNRRGVTVGTGYEWGKAKFAASWGLAKEIDAEATALSYIHRINGLALSRVYNPFPAGATGPIIYGPYGRKLSFFRGESEIVQTTDLDPEFARAPSEKFFNTIDVQAKFNTKFLNRQLYFFYLGYFGGASAKAEALPTYNEDAYLFVQYHEFDLYYEVLSKFVLTAYLGIENARGGRNTRWDVDSQLPLDQFATGVGVGCDWMLAPNSGLYVRHRWMEFEDRSFSLDRYRGQETTIELKTFF